MNTINNVDEPEYKPFFLIPSIQDNYYKMVNLGIEHLKNKKVCLVGIVRDIENTIEPNIKTLYDLFNNATNAVSFFIYENDSTDNTKHKLKELSNTIPNFHYLSETKNLEKFGSVKNASRTTNLATCRNICKDYVKEHYANYDYTIVIDLDYYYYDLDGILNSFGFFHQNPEIDGMAGTSYEIKYHKQLNANNEEIAMPYLWNYDSWAFRLNIWEDLQNFYKTYFRDPMLWFGLWQPPIGSDVISVYSAFGGSCIYKTHEYIRGEYSGGDCEHVNFHKSLSQNNFALYCNPSQFMVFR